MCLKKILSLFKKANIPTPSSGSEPLSIPHPEESPDYSKTVDNTDLDSAMDQWEIDYNLPESYREFWRTKIVITLDADFPYPAATYEQGGVRHLTIRPEWVNSGVIAHEQAHNSYALLTETEKAEFSTNYTPIKTTDPLIVYLYSINSYGLTNDIEGHAEVYRYLGDKMPEVLKQYYRNLFL